MSNTKAKLILEDGTIFEGTAFGAPVSVSGEVVFATGMVGYEQSLTDPSYAGQILTFTYPLIGNWGVSRKEMWESDKVHVTGLIISDLTQKPSHWQSTQTLDSWLKKEKVPAIYGIDTRRLTQKLREHGVMLGKIVIDGKDTKMENPNLRNLVAEVSIAKPRIWLPQKIVGGSRGRVPDLPAGRQGSAQLTNWNQFKASSHKSASTGGRESTDRTREYSLKIGLLNCGAKKNIIRSLLKRGVTVYELPWNFDPFGSNKDLKRGVAPEEGFPSARSSTQQTTINSRTRSEHRRGGNWRQDPEFEIPKLDGLVISNGPGDPKMAKETIQIIKKSMDRKLPTFGICLGNQLLALAAGGDTYKLKFGHRAQNQPTIEVKSGRCYITTQNHGFAVSEKKLPAGFARWFYNANDNTNEGIIHKSLPFFSIQFHPEAAPGPTDTEFLFDYFLERITKHK